MAICMLFNDTVWQLLLLFRGYFPLPGCELLERKDYFLYSELLYYLALSFAESGKLNSYFSIEFEKKIININDLSLRYF